MNIQEALSALRSGKTTATELTKTYLEKAKNSTLHSYLCITEERALKKAQEIDASGDYSAPLAGIPLAIKDVISIAGVQNTAASKILENYKAPYDATVWERLENAGAILLGKTNTDEFTMGSSTENSAFGVTKNPHNPEHVAGGSSGGSAAAVAADECVAALGTDTGGSIRQPAHFCGCVGLKVTYGRVPRYGVISYASSFDTIGPMTKTVTDAASLLEVMAGHDPKDSTTPKKEVPKYTETLSDDIVGKVIGLPTEFLEAEGIDPEIKAKTLEAAKALESRGAKLQEVSLPMTKYAIPTYYLLVHAEASTNLARYDGVRMGAQEAGKDLADMYCKTRGKYLGPEVKRKIMMGTFVLSSGYADAYYHKAAKVRRLFKKEYETVFTKVDALLAPVAPSTAFPIGSKTSDPLQMYLEDIFTVSANLAGIPGISLPVGWINGLPTGVQILGPQFGESSILNLASQLEQTISFSSQHS